MNGLLGAGATVRADLNLLIQAAMGIALLVGMFLARRKRFRAHKYCQASVMLLNLVLIALVMYPSFHRQVEPRIPNGLKDSYYSVAAIHAALGIIAELLGLFIVLRAATNVLPQRFRFKRYKPWMRTELALWWIVILFGFGTYYAWYLRPDSKATPVAATTAAAPSDRVTVKIRNFMFDPRELAIPAGTTVEWIDEGGRHTVFSDDESFKSESLTAGGRFERKFDRPGVYRYYCDFHGGKGGKEMAGAITVVGATR